MSNQNDSNPKNAQSRLYRRLTRLLSGPIIQYRAQSYRRQKRHQLDKYNFESASGQQFKKSAYDPFQNLRVQYIASQNRAERYADFDQMEYTPEIASALDIYSDEMTTYSLLGKMLKIKCRNEEIRSILENLYDNILNIDFNLFGWCRSMCKYGDFFLYMDLDDTLGITNVIALPTMEIERLEGEDESNPNYVQYQWNSGGLTLENWQVAHFRILGDDKYVPYGTSVLEPARRIWRQLVLLEDAMMAYRIVRSPERRLFKIEVGGIPPQDVEQYMHKVMTQMKRNQVVDADTGRVDLRYNPMSVEEDYFLPMRNGVGSDISSLPGGTYTGDIDDVKYLRDKLFSALKIPQSYLSRGEGSDEDKTTLAQKDIRFARTITRLQRSIITELEKIGIIHLFTMGYRGDDLINFKLVLNNPSKISELQELEHWRTKFEVASGATEGFFSRRWVATNLFNMTEDEYLRNIREMYYDRELDATLEATTQQAAGGGEMGLGGGGMDMGGEAGMDMGAEGGMDMGGEAGMDMGGEGAAGPPAAGGEAAPEAPAGGGGLLAAPPGKRDEDWYKITTKDGRTTTNNSNLKWYTPVKYDRRKDSAPRKKSFQKQYSHSLGKATRRNIYPGGHELMSISKGIYENENMEDNYILEEQKILNLNQDLKRFAKNLEKTKDEKDSS